MRLQIFKIRHTAAAVCLFLMAHTYAMTNPQSELNTEYVDPVISGDRPDPSILKIGQDYYLTYSSFDYYPGLTIWHSNNLVDWTPVTAALKTPIGAVYAPSLVYHSDMFHIYIPTVDMDILKKGKQAKRKSVLSVYEIHAPNVEGPWSEPIEMQIFSGVDPGFAQDQNGQKYLFLNDGQMVKLDKTGRLAASRPTKVYEGWDIPEDWVYAGKDLEGPKILRKNGYYYMFSAQGGTAGPATSHMVIVARAKELSGPWENSPYNPLVRTESRAEQWWSKGHATPFQGPKGEWLMALHGYENGYRTLGRQFLLSSFEWSDDHWPVNGRLSKFYGGVKTHRSERELSSPYSENDLGIKFSVYKPEENFKDRLAFVDGGIEITGKGSGPQNASPVAFNVGDHYYEFQTKITVNPGATAGLLLFYNENLFCGLSSDNKFLQKYDLGKLKLYSSAGKAIGSTFYIKVINDRNTASFYLSKDGIDWKRHSSFDVSGYHHNMAGDFLSLRPALFVSGENSAIFSETKYSGLRDSSR